MSAESVVITVGGTLIVILLSVVAFFLVRLVGQLDTLDDRLSDLEKQLALSAQTVEYLKEQLAKLQASYDALQEKYLALEKGVMAFDNWINNLKR